MKKFFISFFLLFYFFLLDFIFKLLEDFYDFIAEPMIGLEVDFFLLDIFEVETLAFYDFLDLNVNDGS